MPLDPSTPSRGSCRAAGRSSARRATTRFREDGVVSRDPRRRPAPSSSTAWSRSAARARSRSRSRLHAEHGFPGRRRPEDHRQRHRRDRRDHRVRHRRPRSAPRRSTDSTRRPSRTTASWSSRSWGADTGWIAAAAGSPEARTSSSSPRSRRPIEDVADHVRKRHAQGRDFSIVVVAEGYRLTRRVRRDRTRRSSRSSTSTATLASEASASVVADEIEQHHRLRDARHRARPRPAGRNTDRTRPPARDAARPAGGRAGRGRASGGAWPRFGATRSSTSRSRPHWHARRQVPRAWIDAGRVVA